MIVSVVPSELVTWTVVGDDGVFVAVTNVVA